MKFVRVVRYHFWETVGLIGLGMSCGSPDGWDFYATCMSKAIRVYG